MLGGLWAQSPHSPLPEPFAGWAASWSVKNPDWRHCVWGETDYLPLVDAGPNADVYRSAVNHAQRAEIARWDILWAHGGVVLDADFECLRRWGGILDGVECFAPEETKNQITMSMLGAVPQHPAVWVARADVSASILAQREDDLDQTYGAGPKMLQRVWDLRDDVTHMPSWMFFPYIWSDPKPDDYGDAYAAHHWTATWKVD